MKNSLTLLFVCAGISMLLVIVNWKDLNSFLARQNLLWFDNVIARKETVMFRSGWIDSLYVKKEYGYYLFMKEEMDSEDILELSYDSVLAIKPTGLRLTSVNENLDTVSLPASALDIIIKDSEHLALFKILSAKKDNAGYLYKLKRISITN